MKANSTHAEGYQHLLRYFELLEEVRIFRIDRILVPGMATLSWREASSPGPA
jgi:hypothetical protein